MKKAANVALILASSLALSQPLMAAGDDHDHGSSGTASSAGTAGTSGTTGTSGTAGTSGTTGTSGTSGVDDSSGTSGTSGTSGDDSRSGTSGTSGDDSSSGTSGRAGDDNSSGTSGSSGKASVRKGTLNSTGTVPEVIVKFKYTRKPRANREELEINAKAKYGETLTRDNAESVELTALFGDGSTCSFELDDAKRRKAEYRIKLSQRGSKAIKEKSGDCNFLSTDLSALVVGPTSISLDDGTTSHEIAVDNF